MVPWVVAILLFVIWLVGVLLHKGGFIHILLLCALAMFVVLTVAHRKARMKDEG
jgi:uncharacterized membrane protein